MDTMRFRHPWLYEAHTTESMAHLRDEHGVPAGSDALVHYGLPAIWTNVESGAMVGVTVRDSGTDLAVRFRVRYAHDGYLVDATRALSATGARIAIPRDAPPQALEDFASGVLGGVWRMLGVDLR